LTCIDNQIDDVSRHATLKGDGGVIEASFLVAKPNVSPLIKLWIGDLYWLRTHLLLTVPDRRYQAQQKNTREN
jgi:hypothetical protein